jgi:hypothetical protein
VFRYFSLYISDAILVLEGVDLPLYSKSMSIKAVVEGGRSASLEALSQVMCRHPRLVQKRRRRLIP